MTFTSCTLWTHLHSCCYSIAVTPNKNVEHGLSVYCIKMNCGSCILEILWHCLANQQMRHLSDVWSHCAVFIFCLIFRHISQQWSIILHHVSSVCSVLGCLLSYHKKMNNHCYHAYDEALYWTNTPKDPEWTKVDLKIWTIRIIDTFGRKHERTRTTVDVNARKSVLGTLCLT